MDQSDGGWIVRTDYRKDDGMSVGTQNGVTAGVAASEKLGCVSTRPDGGAGLQITDVSLAKFVRRPARQVSRSARESDKSAILTHARRGRIAVSTATARGIDAHQPSNVGAQITNVNIR